jgi:hypothetical protein
MYVVVVQLVDSQSPAFQAAMTYTITVSAPAPGPLSITSGAPSDGAVGQQYGGTHYIFGFSITGFILSASGGLPSYSWSWAAAPGSSLPPGLKIEVLFRGGGNRCCLSVPVIDGTPTMAGTYDVVVTVKDAASPPNSVSANYTITVQ